jgi:hypothetical protein
MGGGHGAKTVLQRFLPTESYAIAVPVTVALCFFGGMLTRIFVSDPEVRLDSLLNIIPVLSVLARDSS